MINDGVCDEATNNEKCLFDGKDCCIQNTAIDVSLCRNCTCQLDIDYEGLRQKFKDYKVEIYLDSHDSDKHFNEVKVIDNVANEEVCAELCLPGQENRFNTKGKPKVDSWIYNGTSPNQTCACTRMEVCYYRQHVVSVSDFKKHCSQKEPVKRHVMLKEAFDCGMHKMAVLDSIACYIALDKYFSESLCFTEDKMFGDQEPLLNEAKVERTSTALHCQRACQEFDGCTHFTWVSPFYTGKEFEINACLLRSTGKFQVETVGMTSGPSQCPQVVPNDGAVSKSEQVLCQQQRNRNECM